MLLLFIDSMCIILSLIISNYIRHRSFFWIPTEEMRFSILLCMCLGIFLIANLMFRINKDYYIRGPFHELLIVLGNNLIILVGITLILYFLKKGASTSRGLLFLFVLINTVLTTLVHQLLKALLPKLYHGVLDYNKLLIIADHKLAESIVNDVRNSRDFRQEIVGIAITDRKDLKEFMDIPVVAGIDDLMDYCKASSLDEVIIAVEMIRPEEKEIISELMQVLAVMGITIHYRIEVPELSEARHKMLVKVGGMYTVTYANQVVSMGQILLKRAMDIFGGFIGCLVTGILFILFGPLIKLQSHGSVIFTQKRIGRNGRVFDMYKFRSMYADAEERKKELMENNEMDGLMFKMDNDPRVTPIGRFLRKTSLDEFPQFYNILKGDMSLVGTRPPTLDEFNDYTYYHKKRLSFRPGLTGMWQVSGRNDITDFEEVVKLDIEYIDDWSLLLDIKILLKTLVMAFKGK